MRHDGRGVEVARVLHPEDEDADVLVLGQPPDLLLEKVRRAEEELALDVDDRDLRMGPLGGIVSSASLPLSLIAYSTRVGVLVFCRKSASETPIPT